MAETLTELVAKINVDASGLKKGLADAEKQSEYSAKQIQDSLNKVSKSMAIAGGAITAAMGLMGKAAEEERVNIARLSAMLKNAGVSYDEVSEALERNIKATQRKTGIADSEQRDVLGRLVLVTKDYNKALSLLPLVLDLAAAGQMDVTTAATYLGKGMEELADGAETITIRLGQASMQFRSLEEIQQAVGGTAEATANQFSILSAELSDMQEQIGAQLLPILNNVVENIIPIVENIGRWAEENPILVESIAKFGGALIAAAAALKGVALLLAIVNALQGPKGWINLAVAVAVAGGAYFGIEQLLKNTKQELGDESQVIREEVLPSFIGLTAAIDGASNSLKNGESATQSYSNKVAGVAQKIEKDMAESYEDTAEAAHKSALEQLAYMNMIEFNARETALNLSRIFSQAQMDIMSKLDIAVRNKWLPEDINKLINQYYGTNNQLPSEVAGAYIDPQSVLQGPGPAPGSAEASTANYGEGFMGYVPGEGPVWAEGYANGGIVPGSIGQPQLAMVHGGEEIIPANETSSRSNVNIYVQGSVVTERQLGEIAWKYLLKKNRTDYTTGLS